jgi:hypothetical protein
MPENPLHDETRQLAEQVAAFDNEDVIDSAASIAAWNRRERLVVLGFAAVDSMVNDGREGIDEADPPGWRPCASGSRIGCRGCSSGRDRPAATREGLSVIRRGCRSRS